MTLVSALIAGCSQEREITYRNASGMAVQLYIDDRFVDVIEPGESIARSSKEGSHTIRAIGQDGSIVLNETFTWEGLKEVEFMVVIDDQ